METKKISQIFLIAFTTITLLSCGSEVKKEYFPNGNVKYEWEVKDGLRNGITKSYFDNGNLETEGEYVNDRPTGWHSLYYENGKIHQRKLYSIVLGNERIEHKLLYDKEGHLIADIKYANKNITSELVKKQTIHVNDTVVVKLTIHDAKYQMCAADLGEYDENLNEKQNAKGDYFAHRGNNNHEVLMGIQLTKPGPDTLTWMVFDYNLKYDSDSVETQIGEQSYVRLVINVEP